MNSSFYVNSASMDASFHTHGACHNKKVWQAYMFLTMFVWMFPTKGLFFQNLFFLEWTYKFRHIKKLKICSLYSLGCYKTCFIGWQLAMVCGSTKISVIVNYLSFTSNWNTCVHWQPLQQPYAFWQLTGLFDNFVTYFQSIIRRSFLTFCLLCRAKRNVKKKTLNKNSF